jgi:hypothetical protein
MVLGATIAFFFFFIILLIILLFNFSITYKRLGGANFFSILWGTIHNRDNPHISVLCRCCALGMANQLLYISLGMGLILNMVQQVCLARWMIAYFRHILSMLDPFERVLNNSKISLFAYGAQLLLIVWCISVSILAITGNPTVLFQNGTSMINVYFVGIASFIFVLNLSASNYVLLFNVTCIRAIQNDSGSMSIYL